MTRLGGLEFQWLAAAPWERDTGKRSHLSGSRYLQWSLRSLRLHVYKSVRQKRKQTVILFCSGTGGELSSWSLSSTTTAAAVSWASEYHSRIPSVPAPTPCCQHWSLCPQSCPSPPSSDSWERPRQPAVLTCPLSELRGVEIVASLISYAVMSLLPLLPVPGKAEEGGIPLASKVGALMQEKKLF